MLQSHSILNLITSLAIYDIQKFTMLFFLVVHNFTLLNLKTNIYVFYKNTQIQNKMHISTTFLNLLLWLYVIWHAKLICPLQLTTLWCIFHKYIIMWQNSNFYYKVIYVNHLFHDHYYTVLILLNAVWWTEVWV